MTVLDKLFGLIERRKTTDRLLLRGLFFLIIISGILYVYQTNKDFSSPVPARGGELIEGIVGIPRFVNPVLAITRADQDSVSLLYSGLLKIDENGGLVNDLAENIEISEDGKTYNISVRRDLSFHDGTPITARDVAFTYSLVQDPDLKSPLRGNWMGVTVTEIDEYQLSITLEEAYAPFIENFTLGIMPRHLWGGLPIEQLPFSQYNTEPVGSGPFTINTVLRDANGLISGYNLKPVNGANLSEVKLKFFKNETDLKSAIDKKEVTATAYLPLEQISSLDGNYNIMTSPLPRVFGIFFNQNRSPALRDKSARLALSEAINREDVVSNVLDGYGVPISLPIIGNPSELQSSNKTAAETLSKEAHLENARQILKSGGWTRGEDGLWTKRIDQTTETLSLTIRTSNSPVFDETVNLIADYWRQLGVEVQIEQYEQAGLVQSVIRTRDFQSLLFGLDMNRSQDLYPFWHSSQKDDPGLNISQYTNVTIDRKLEESRKTQDEATRLALQTEIGQEITEEMPAIFIFAPSLTYVVDKNLSVRPINRISKPSDRFMNINEWYAKTEVLWPIFQTNNNNLNEVN
jgi:peptide/nickel transport system substrate-binding protein